jgi:pSer/pThr/pTyr-binding forkhead associated (FHA) protein
MTDPASIRWESLGAIAGAFALAIWALGDPETRTPPAAVTESSVLRFRVQLKNRPARIIEVRDGARLGRSANSEVVLDDSTVSKHHAQVRFEGHAWIEDLGSTNGTLVNGKRVAGPTALRRGDRIALGTAKLVFLGLANRGHHSPKG